MNKPNYNDGSIVNLMSSITKALGDKPRYKPLKALPPGRLKSRNIVLLVIDGLGYEYLMKHGKGSVLAANLEARITSAFPPTTAVGVTAFLTGVPAQQHALTGWFVYLKEINVVSTILPFISRATEENLGKRINPKKIFNQKPVFDKIKAESYLVIRKDLINSDYTIATAGKASRLGYTTLAGYFRQVKRAMNSSSRRKLIYAYWPGFDKLAHEYGVSSRKVYNHFKDLDKSLDSFLSSIEGSNTTVIVTADHGFVDTSKKRTIFLRQHPKLAETLVLPLCGESRSIYCYVKPSKAKEFEKYVKKLPCKMFKSKDLVKRNYFGLFKPNPKLFDRIGTHVLIMDEGYVFKDELPGEERSIHKGSHAGMSDKELYVPLIVFEK